MPETFDLAVVGAGIVGLGHALAAARRGLRVVVVDRDSAANGASIRNFGLVVVSGQTPGPSYRRAQRSREVWLATAAEAKIDVLHRGMVIAAQRPEALGAIEAFCATPEGASCQVLTAAELAEREPSLAGSSAIGGFFSPHELRVESSLALPRLVEWLQAHLGVSFRFGTAVRGVEPGRLLTSIGDVAASRIAICPGDDLTTLFGDTIAEYRVRRCKLQMLRLADPGFRLKSALMSDLSLLRYGAFATLPETAALRRRLESERASALANGVHLIVTQSADGSLVVGDSHHYGATPDPFASTEIDTLILAEYEALFRAPPPRATAHWVGTYASSSKDEALRLSPCDGVRLVIVTSGTGASTGFALGEETIAELFGN